MLSLQAAPNTENLQVRVFSFFFFCSRIFLSAVDRTKCIRDRDLVVCSKFMAEFRAISSGAPNMHQSFPYCCVRFLLPSPCHFLLYVITDGYFKARPSLLRVRVQAL